MFFDKFRSLSGLALILAGLLLFSVSTVEARDIEFDFEDEMNDEFEDFVTEIGSAFSYIPAYPARSRGIIGWDVGVDFSTIDISDDKDYMNKGFGDNAPSYAFLPRVRAGKGLPGDLDVSAFISGDPQGNARLYGGSLKYAFISGGTFLTDILAEPTAAVRLHGTQLSGVSDFDLYTYGADLSASMNFPLLTPYAGVSHVEIEGSEEAGIGLDDVSTDDQRYFIGTGFSLGLIEFFGEANFGESETYTVRGNIGF